VTFEEYPDHLQMTVGDGLVKGRNTVRISNVHVHIRMREKMQNSLENGKTLITEVKLAVFSQILITINGKKYK
jgi:hypothetical protein